MPGLPKDAGPAAEFLVRHLYRPVDIGADGLGAGGLGADGRCFAIAETEHPDGGDWFWSDDNAKVLELMSRPELWRRYRREGSALLRFVRAMCRGPFVFRRLGAPHLEAAGAGGGPARYRHSLLRLGWDPAQASVIAGLRFHDERDGDNLTLGGNYVEFTYRGRRCKEPVSAAGAVAECDGRVLRLHHAAELHAAPMFRQRRRLGTIAYTYIFDAGSALFEVEAALDLDPGAAVADVVLTIGHGGLDRCLFSAVVTDQSAQAAPVYAAGVPSVRLFDAAGAAYYMIRQLHISGDSLAVHSVPRRPHRLAGVETVVTTQGRLDRVVARYAFPGTSRGGRLAVAEYKTITAGGFYDRVADYAALMREAAAAQRQERGGAGRGRAARDLSISYDYGVTLNALAKCFVAASAEAAGRDAGCGRDELRSAFDELLRHYCALYADRHAARPNAIFSRELAFAALGAATMAEATEAAEYRARLRRLVDILLDFEAPLGREPGGAAASVFLMRKDSPHACLDCQSAALLALTAAARSLDDPRLPAAIERGLAAWQIVPRGIDLGPSGAAGAAGAIDTLGIAAPGGGGSAVAETALWNFKAGLALRFLGALRRSPVVALQTVASRCGERIARSEAVLRRQVAHSAAERGGAVEFRTSALSAETNSETQPWVALGLFGHPLD